MSKQAKRASDLICKPSEFKTALYDLAKAGRSVFAWGPPGIGKSQIAFQVANELGFVRKTEMLGPDGEPMIDYAGKAMFDIAGFSDIRLSQMDPVDLRGFPMPVKDALGDDVIKLSRPDFYDPTTLSGKNKAFYLFDEMNSAPQSIQAAAYQIVLDRCIGPHKLGPLDFVMAAGNRETDRGATFKMPTPLMNRFIHLELKTDFEDWQTHALGAYFHPTVVGYVTFAKQDLFQFDASSASRGYPTPRSWEAVSDVLNSNPAGGEAIMTAIVAGAVGEGVAVKFMEYRRKAENLPNPTDILMGKVKELKEKDVSLMYTLTTALCYEMKQQEEKMQNGTPTREETKQWHEMSNNFLGFMLKNFSHELVIMGARTALAIHKIELPFQHMEQWDDFSERYSDIILAT